MRLLSLACGFALSLLLGGCAGRSLPKYQPPIARARFQSVRTTAYTHTEADHIRHGRSTAAGGQLSDGRIKSAAADWSRWPLGTVFRVQETGELFRVDDYGWALVGTNTIDLYKPTRSAMNLWGVRRVTIENLVWGNRERSVAILEPRSKYKHVRFMLKEFRQDQDEFPALAGLPPEPVRMAKVEPSSATRLKPFQAKPKR
jgi:3D (Asp-Asp-Asp) domain-containing protein